ncbi:MAG: hypothetical protein Kow0029_21810 [Candidatus Rifleibacteriota bacterium]
MILLFVGIIYIASLNREIKLRGFEAKAAEKLELLRYVSFTEKYICMELAKLFDRAKSAGEIKDMVAAFLEQHSIKAEFLIWNGNGNVFFSSFDHKSWGGNWEKGYFDLLEFYHGKYKSESQIPLEKYKNLRILFGPQFFPRYFHRSFRGSPLHLMYNDSSRNRPLLWLRIEEKFGLACFFNYDISDSFVGARRVYAEHKPEDISLAIIDHGRIFAKDPKIEKEIAENLELINNNFKNIFETSHFYAVINQINDNLAGLCLMKKSDIDSLDIPGWLKTVTLSGFFLIVFFLLKSYLIVVCGQPFAAPVRNQLVMLFLFSNALPGFVLTILAWDYILQYQNSLVRKIHTGGIAYLQSIDELSINEMTFQRVRLNKGFKVLHKGLKRHGVKGSVIKKFLSLQKPEPYRCFIIGSSTPYVCSSEAIMKNGKLVEYLDGDFKNNPHKERQLTALNKIGKFFLATLNKTSISKKVGTEVEMLTETLSQQTPVQLIQEFLDCDNDFWSWGIGHKKFPAFVKVFRLFSQKICDYLFLYLWDSKDLQKSYLKRMFNKFNRNESGYKIMVIDTEAKFAMPGSLFNNEKLVDYANRLKDRDVRSHDFCNWEGKDYLLFGLKCVKLDHFRLLGLFPMDAIKREVRQKTDFIVALALVSFLITFSLGLFVSRSVLNPLHELGKGIKALQSRKFSYRLPELGNDEFGYLARIFNTTLIDLEEMHTVAKVKDLLITEATDGFCLGDLKIYGRIINSDSIGGGFLDIEVKDQESARIVTGSVAGGGISSVLILAFIKSALIQLEPTFKSAGEIVNGLDHLLSRSTKRGSKRFMALQYLKCFSDGRIEMVNAGGIYPLLINSCGQVRSVESPSSPIGTAVNKMRKVEKFSMQSGETLLLFSNGVLAGGKIEYDELIEFVKNLNLDFGTECYNDFVANFMAKFSKKGIEKDVSLVLIQKFQG